MSRSAMLWILGLVIGAGCGGSKDAANSEMYEISMRVVDVTDDWVELQLEGPIHGNYTEFSLVDVPSEEILSQGQGAFQVRLSAFPGDGEHSVTGQVEWRDKDIVKTATATFVKKAKKPGLTRVASAKVDGDRQIDCMGDYPSGDFPDFVNPSHGLRLSFTANAGDRVELAGQTWTASADGDRWDTTLDLSRAIFAAPAESLTQDERIKVADIKVTSSADRSESYYLECALGPYAARLFTDGAKAPVVGPGEDPSSKPVGLLWWHNDKLYGSPKTVADVHLVAKVDTPKERTRACGRYRADDGETKIISNAAVDKIVTVFDRRTGKQVARKQFRASMPACPRTIDATYSGIRAEVEDADIASWLSSVLK